MLPNPPTTYGKGFSLIELLVVISIIGLVTGIGTSFVLSIQRNTRNVQREADLRVLQGALQQFYADQNFYPNILTLTGEDPINNCTGQATCPSISKTYLSSTPKDPTSGTITPYCYSAQYSITDPRSCSGENSGKCHYYFLCATLESPPVSTSCSCSNGGGGTGNTKVTPL